jgi:hypothetical protein
MMHDRVSQQTLYLFCYSLVGLAGAKLFIDSLRALL